MNKTLQLITHFDLNILIYIFVETIDPRLISYLFPLSKDKPWPRRSSRNVSITIELLEL